MNSVKLQTSIFISIRLTTELLNLVFPKCLDKDDEFSKKFECLEEWNITGNGVISTGFPSGKASFYFLGEENP